jgi:hypothetical protein
MRALLEVDDDADVLGRLVAQAADALYLLVAHEVGNAHYHVGLVDAVRDRGDDDLEVALLVFDYLGITAHDDAARPVE